MGTRSHCTGVGRHLSAASSRRFKRMVCTLIFNTCWWITRASRSSRATGRLMVVNFIFIFVLYCYRLSSCSQCTAVPPSALPVLTVILCMEWHHHLQPPHHLVDHVPGQVKVRKSSRSHSTLVRVAPAHVRRQRTISYGAPGSCHSENVRTYLIALSV